MINHLGTMTLETARLMLRQHRMSDAADMYANWCNDAEVVRFWNWDPHESVNVTRELLAKYVAQYVNRNVYHWIMELKSTAQAIGYIYMSDFDETARSASVHYLLSRKHWGCGLMPEACERVLAFAFDNLHLAKVATRHHELNHASCRVLQKCGLRHTHDAPHIDADCERISGIYKHYEITEDEWFGRFTSNENSD